MLRTFHAVSLTIFKLFVTIRFCKSFQNPKIFEDCRRINVKILVEKQNRTMVKKRTGNGLLQFWVFLLCVRVEITLKNRIYFAGSMAKKSWLRFCYVSPRYNVIYRDMMVINPRHDVDPNVVYRICVERSAESLRFSINDENCY